MIERAPTSSATGAAASPQLRHRRRRSRPALAKRAWTDADGGGEEGRLPRQLLIPRSREMRGAKNSLRTAINGGALARRGAGAARGTKSVLGEQKTTRTCDNYLDTHRFSTRRSRGWRQGSPRHRAG